MTNFLGSPNMYTIAHGATVDFTATFSDEEYGHRYYSGLVLADLAAAHHSYTVRSDRLPAHGDSPQERTISIY